MTLLGLSCSLASVGGACLLYNKQMKKQRKKKEQEGGGEIKISVGGRNNLSGRMSALQFFLEGIILFIAKKDIFLRGGWPYFFSSSMLS